MNDRAGAALLRPGSALPTDARRIRRQRRSVVALVDILGAKRNEGTGTMSEGDQTDQAGRATGPDRAPAGAAGRPIPPVARPPARRRPARTQWSPQGTDGTQRAPAGPPGGLPDADQPDSPDPSEQSVEQPVIIDPVIETPSRVGTEPSAGGGSRGGANPTARRVSRNGGGPPVGPIAILAIAGAVLVVLLAVILLSQGDEPRLETAPPCIQASVADALTEIADGGVTNIRASAAANDLTRFAIAVELDIEGGGCLSLPQGPESVDQRTAIIGAATIYNSQTEGRQINIEIDEVDIPPTETPAPLPTEVPPTEAPAIPPTEGPVVIPPVILPPAATPATPPVASPIA